MRWRIGSDAGTVTAEFAVALPAIILVLAAVLGGMQVVGEQLRLEGAVADAARLLGRGDSGAAARLHEVIPAARLSATRRGDLLCAAASAPTAVGVLVRLTLNATACTLDDAQ